MGKLLALILLATASLAADPDGPPACRNDSFEMVPVAVIPLVAMAQMPFGDADHDGKGEVYLLSRDRWLAVAIEHATGNSFDSTELPIPLHSAYLVADADRDGKSELVAMYDQMLQFHESLDSTSLPESLVWLDTVRASSDPFYPVVADLDGDSACEVACLDFPEHTVRVYENTGDNTYERTATLPCVPDAPAQAMTVTHDLDRDGRPELVTGLWNGWLSFYEAVADDSFELVAQDSMPSVNYPGRGLAGMPDADRDGRSELVSLFISHSQHAILSVYEASGDNEFEVVWRHDEYNGSMSRLGVAVGDLDGDSVPEFFVDFGAVSRLYRCVGNDSFVSIWQSVDYEWPAAIYDINSDGLGELICKSGRDETTILQYVPLGIAEHPPNGIQPLTFPTVMRASDLARVEGRVIDVQGRVLASGQSDIANRISSIRPGVYFIVSEQSKIGDRRSQMAHKVIVPR